jgi:hypothetical protein
MDIVTNPIKLERVLRMCRLASGTSATSTRLPFESPCSIDRDTLFPPTDQLFVSPKADGVRYLLCLCTDDNQRFIATLVNRAQEAYSVRVSAPESWYRLGCVFDGEMCENLRYPRRNIYLVFNVLCFRGESFFHHSYRDRVSCMARAVPSELLFTDGERRTFGSCVLMSANEAFDIVSKPVRCASELRELLAEQLPYKTDGVVFTPLHDPMTTGRNNKILKWKADNTIDVRLVVNQDNTYDLVAADKGHQISLKEVMTHVFILCDRIQAVIRGERLFRKLKTMAPAVFDPIVELSITPGISPLLTYQRLRMDKSTPNDMYTIKRTVVSAESAISSDRLCDIVLNTMENRNSVYY